MRTCLTVVTCVLLGVVGCGPVNPPTPPLLKPGQEAVLTYRTEMWDRGVMMCETTAEGADGKIEAVSRTEMPKGERIPFQHEVLLTARDATGHLAIDVTPRRLWVGSEVAEPDGKQYSGEGNWWVVPGYGSAARYLPLLNSRFHAVLEGRRVREFTPSGPARRAVAAGMHGGLLEPEHFGRAVSTGIALALEDALAYLPPEGAKAGTVWQVRRERVLPYQIYGYYMMSNGARWMSEHSVCRVARVRESEDGRVAVVRISGRRKPGPPAKSMPERVSHLSLTGSMEINFDTREIVELTIETAISWLGLEDAVMLNIRFKDTVRLKPQ